MNLWINFCQDKKAQISAEMIIVLAALIGIAIIVIKKLTESVSKTSNTLDTKADALNQDLEKIGTE